MLEQGKVILAKTPAAAKKTVGDERAIPRAPLCDIEIECPTSCLAARAACNGKLRRGKRFKRSPKRDAA